jgi:predicted ArsR family transcriptional regulator
VTEPAPSPSSTKRAVLELIKRNGPRTVAQLREALDLSGVAVSGVAVRRHLETLQKEGLVTQTTRALGRGRPAHLYELTEAGNDLFPRNYDQLASQLLDAVRAQLGDDGVERMFAHRQRILAERYADRTAGRDLCGLAGELAAIQDENGYMAECQPDGDDREERFLVREHNCAIAKVAGAHPSACRHELALFQQLAGPGIEVERVAHMQAGDLECAYVLRQATKAGPSEQPSEDPSEPRGNGANRRRSPA